MKTRYEIQTFTLCDGWINTWMVIHEIGDGAYTEPETFATEAEAQVALDEFLSDIQSEIEAGQRSIAEAYAAADFRIAEVQPNPPHS